MSAALGAKRREDILSAIDPSVAKALEHFVKKSKYDAPKVVSFPLNGMQADGRTSLSGNL